MKSFDSLIDPETLASVQQARELHARVSRTMPRDAAAHLVFCRLDDDQLRLTVNNASWLAKLRFSERQLLRTLASDGIAVKRISWHVAPPEKRPERAAPRRARLPGPSVAAHLRALANDLEDNDSPGENDSLGKSLNRLADVLHRARD